MTVQRARKIAELITDRLCTNGAGEKAERLMLVLPGGKDGGGYGRFVIVDMIVEILIAEPKP